MRRSKVVLTALCVTALLGGLTALPDAETPANAGEKEGQKPAESAPIAREGFVLKKEYLTDRDIPTYVLYAEEFAQRKKPVVICIHGGGTFHPPTEWPTSKKEMWLQRGLDDGVYRLAGHGFMVMMIDGWWGGERYKPEYAQLVEENVFAANFRGWRETAEDISRIIDYLATRPEADQDRVGIMGGSGGGPLADIIKTVPGLQEEIKKFDAAYAYERIPPIALAIINNKTDPVVPYEKVRELYEKLKPLYSEYPERLKFELLELPEPKHGLPPEGFIHGYEWLERFLLEGTGAKQ
jgi:acetyl esterase/lipase